jgi:hypothetical protein
VPGSLVSREPRTVALVDKSVATATEMGHVLLECDDAFLRQTSVLLAGQLGHNPTSVGCLADNGCTSSFTDSCVTPMEESTIVVLSVCAGDLESRLYQLPSPVSWTSTAVDISLAAADASVWRRRLVHLNQRDLAAAHEFVDDIPPTGTDDSCCRPCRLGEAHKLPFRGRFPRATAVGRAIHSDIMEPLPASFQDRYRSIVTFVDNCSRYLFVGLVHRQSDLSAA